MGGFRYDPHQLGRAGEDRAQRWYLSRGYELVARNWRCREGEIDLVLRMCDRLVFAEVKTRATDRYGTPFDAVDVHKQRRLRFLAGRFLAAYPGLGNCSVRFDAVAVVGTRVEVREGVL